MFPKSTVGLNARFFSPSNHLLLAKPHLHSITELTKQGLNTNVTVHPMGNRKAATAGSDPQSTVLVRTSLHEASCA